MKHANLTLLMVVKDEDGNTFESIDSLNFLVTLSTNTLATATYNDSIGTTKKPFSSMGVGGKSYLTLIPTNKEGHLDITVRFIGFDQNVLDKHKIQNLPRIPDTVEEDYDYYADDDYDTDRSEYFFSDTIGVIMASPSSIAKLNVANGRMP